MTREEMVKVAQAIQAKYEEIDAKKRVADCPDIRSPMILSWDSLTWAAKQDFYRLAEAAIVALNESPPTA